MEKGVFSKSKIIAIIIAVLVLILALAVAVYAILFVTPSNSNDFFKNYIFSNTSKAQVNMENDSITKNNGEDLSSDKDTYASYRKSTTNKNNESEYKSGNTTKSVRPEKVTKVFSFNTEFSDPEYKIAVFNDTQNGIQLPYRMYLPENYVSSKKYPVLIFLHSLGEVGNDNTVPAIIAKKMFKYNADLVSQAFILCPQSNEWWNLNGTLSSVLHLLDEIKRTYSCDSNRIYVTGISMGGCGTWDLLSEHGDVFAAGMPMCGWGDVSKGDALKDVPIRIYHSADDNTVPISKSKDMYNAIINAGGLKANLFELDGLGHDLTDYVFYNRDAFCWLFAQDKAKNPKCKYEYIPYFKVVDSNGKTVISDEDIDDVIQTAGYEGEEYVFKVDMYLNLSGKSSLNKAYKKGTSEEFTVYWLDQKLYSFVATKTSADDVFSIVNIFDDENITTFLETVEWSCEKLK